MDALAHILIQLDVTPAQLAEVSRASFVKVGASVARKKLSGRPHIARVAALTGIPRSEVRRIIEANYGHSAGGLDQLPRALKVIAAWKTSSKYTRNGKPLVLKSSGRAPSFEALCREFSGDIPPKAIATELLERNLIRITERSGKPTLRLLRSGATSDPEVEARLSFVASLVAAVSSQDQVLVARSESLVSPKNLSASYFRNSVSTQVSSFVDGLPIETRRRIRKANSAEILEVFALVSRKTFNKR